MAAERSAEKSSAPRMKRLAAFFRVLAAVCEWYDLWNDKEMCNWFERKLFTLAFVICFPIAVIVGFVGLCLIVYRLLF
jgi:hypothetical protein